MSNLKINQSDLTFKASRSSGPGGQNINKLNTKVAVILDIPNCSFLNDEQKQTILKKLQHRLTKDNRLIVESQKFRTQRANRDYAVEKLAVLLENTLRRQKARRPTKPSFAAIERRLKQKRQRSITKKQREKNISLQ